MHALRDHLEVLQKERERRSKFGSKTEVRNGEEGKSCSDLFGHQNFLRTNEGENARSDDVIFKLLGFSSLPGNNPNFLLFGIEE